MTDGPMRRRLAIAAAAGLLWSCPGGTTLTGSGECAPCRASDDCGHGLVCATGVCVPADRIPGEACDGADTDLCAEGEWTCIEGHSVCTDHSGDALDLCNGVDDDCDPTTPDGVVEGWLGNACDGLDWDLCAEGELRCREGTARCTDESDDNAELCDGLDDDCDGVIDEGCECVDGWVQALPIGELLDAVWVAPSGVAYAAGYGGTIVRVDGSVAARMESGTGGRLTGIWGASESDIYAVGDGRSSPWDYRPAESPVLLHYDGVRWSGLDVEGTFAAVWGRSGSDVFAVGDGVVAHYDGREWTREIREGMRFSHVWGTPDGDVLAVAGLSVLRFDGVGWEEVSSAPPGVGTRIIVGAWGSSIRDVFVAATDTGAYGSGHGTLFHDDGTGFEEIDLGIASCFTAVWGTSGRDVHVVGRYGLALHYDGSAWTSLDSGTDETLRAIGGNAVGDVYAVGGTALTDEYRTGSAVVERYDGRAWKPAAALAPPVDFVGVQGFADGVFAFGRSDVRCGVNRPLDPCSACCMIGPAFGYPWTSSVHLDDHTWRGAFTHLWPLGPPEWPVSDYLNRFSLIAVWGESGDGLLGIGLPPFLGFKGPEPPPEPVRFDGRRWEGGDPGECGSEFPASDLWGASPTDVFAVGPGICHYDGETWRPMPAPAEAVRVRGVSGRDVYAVGGDTVLHYDGSEWSVAASLGPGVRLAGVRAASRDDVFVVGDTGDEAAPAGVVFHYDGAAWSAMDVEFAGSLRDVWATSEGKALAVGTGGGMLRYGGSTWEPIEPVTSADLNAISARSDADVYVVGDAGTVLHRCGADW